MNLTDYVIMPSKDYIDICDAVRKKTGSTLMFKSGDLASSILKISGNSEAIIDGGYAGDVYWLLDNTKTLSLRGNGSMTEAPWSKWAEIIERVSIEDGIIDICNGAFAECTNLKDVALPSSITSVGDFAFSECSNLKDVALPDSITSVGEGAFYKCSNIAAIELPVEIKSIGSTAFCETGISEILLPASLQTIGDQAFAWITSDGLGKLTNITILNPDISFGFDVFDSSVSGITRINFSGSENSWRDIATTNSSWLYYISSDNITLNYSMAGDD